MHRVPRKCAGTTSQPPSAAFSKSVRRTRRASTGSMQLAVDNAGSSTSAGDCGSRRRRRWSARRPPPESPIVPACDPAATATLGLSRALAIVNELQLSGLKNGQHAVPKGGQLDCIAAGFAVLLLPILELAPAGEIARVGKGRDPPAVAQTRVPADMIDVKVVQNTISTDSGRTPACARRSRKPLRWRQ